MEQVIFEDPEFERPVPVRFTVHGERPPLLTELFNNSATLGIWRKIGRKHQITFYPDGISSKGKSGKWNVSIEADTVNLSISGQTRWSHTFSEGNVGASIMHIGGLVTPVVVDVKTQSTTVESLGGCVKLFVNLVDEEENFPLSIEFLFGSVPESSKR